MNDATRKELSYNVGLKCKYYYGKVKKVTSFLIGILETVQLSAVRPQYYKSKTIFVY